MNWRKRYLTIFILIWIITLGENLLGQEGVVKLERQFNEEVIDTIFSETDMEVKSARNLGAKGLEQKNENDKVKVKYPKVVIIKGGVKFLDIEGNVVKEIESYNPVQISPNKKLIGLRPNQNGYEDMSIFDQEGGLKRNFKIKPLEGIGISDDASYVVFGSKVGLMPMPGVIDFYDNTGKLLKEVKEINGKECFIYKFKYTLDNNYILYLVSTVKSGKNTTEDSSVYLVCFNKNGDEIWKYKLEELDKIGLMSMYYTTPFDQLEISDDSKKIFIRGRSKTKEKKMTWILDVDGNLIEEKEGWE